MTSPDPAVIAAALDPDVLEAVRILTERGITPTDYAAWLNTQPTQPDEGNQP